MYLYKITNNINNKIYIGITIDYKRRWKQHIKMNSQSLIHKAILKYGENNFTFELLFEDLDIEKAEELEKEKINEYNSLIPNGYNIAKGGLYGGRGNILTDEEIQYIKDNRNKPMYLLYDEFSEKMSYGYFKMIYHDKERKDIVPHIDMYPNNLEFSCQFTRSKLTYDDIVYLRTSYANHKSWDEIYPKYKDIVAKSTFIQIYNGRSFSLVMPEVFTEENRHIIMSKSNQGEKNSHSKLNVEQVKEIRRLHNEEHKTNKEISRLFPQVSAYTISDIIRYKTWKHI